MVIIHRRDAEAAKEDIKW